MSTIDDVIQDVGAERNGVAAEVEKLTTRLAEKNRELRELEAALKALKQAKRR